MAPDECSGVADVDGIASPTMGTSITAPLTTTALVVVPAAALLLPDSLRLQALKLSAASTLTPQTKTRRTRSADCAGSIEH